MKSYVVVAQDITENQPQQPPVIPQQPLLAPQANHAAILNTSVNRGKGGVFWLAVKPKELNEVTKQIKSYILDLNTDNNFKGFREFSGSLTTQVTLNNIDIIESILQDIEQRFNAQINRVGLEKIRQDFQLLKPQGGSDSPASETIENFRQRLQTELQTKSADEHVQAMADLVDRQLENLANQVDETKKQGFIKDFLEFSSHFWNYSFSNTILIFFQTGGKAQHVAGGKKWETMGRKVRDDEKRNGIAILAPSMSKMDYPIKSPEYGKARIVSFLNNFINSHSGQTSTKNPQIRQELQKAMTSLSGGDQAYLHKLMYRYDDIRFMLEEAQKGIPVKGKGAVRGFRAVSVFDVGQTDIDTEYEEKTGKKPFEPVGREVWDPKGGEGDEKADLLSESVIRHANETGIDVEFDLGDLEGAAGTSSGGTIKILGESLGESKLRTLVHEIAHEILHWKGSDGRSEVGSGSSRKEKEIDADATTYIVLSHFGYDLSEVPNYLALSGANSQEIKKRRDTIQYAVKQIIGGMQKHLNNIVGSNEQSAVAGSLSWYKTAKSNFDFNKTFIQLRYLWELKY